MRKNNPEIYVLEIIASGGFNPQLSACEYATSRYCC